MCKKLLPLIGLIAVAWFCMAAAADRRNPFELDDVDDPDGQDVQDFAAECKLKGDMDDANAEQWVKEATPGKAGSLDGEWSGRWESGSGRAKVRVVKDRVFILYTDVVCGDDGATWLLEAVRFDKNKLRGRWVNIANKEDTGVFFGLIVDEERIDGSWGEGLRWDFRRKLKQ
jgi:hypothetical protein